MPCYLRCCILGFSCPVVVKTIVFAQLVNCIFITDSLDRDDRGVYTNITVVKMCKSPLSNTGDIIRHNVSCFYGSRRKTVTRTNVVHVTYVLQTNLVLRATCMHYATHMR